ncbi:major facilitator superfamily protein [Zymoseptoria brevis]|uniref:Major facilitator superfamily protein n=1 Tax=Zymoseptoria brevis TaxID=1047168 RepID=A0A0F4GEP1_9PEZI|nr:major facilitator superfamily protein [Zymoseptoria brevis]
MAKAPTQQTFGLDMTKNASTKSSKPDTSPVEDATTDNATASPEQDNTPPKDIRFWMIIFSICLSSFLSALDTSILSPALQTIASALHSRDLFVWAVNAFLVTCTITSLVSAHISDLFGRRSVMMTSIMLFAIGSAVCGAAPSTAVLILGRAIQGIGSGGILTMSNLITCDIVPLRERSLYGGLLNLAWTVATLIGPLIGGAFTQHISWRWMFWINLPASAIALAIVAMFLRLEYPDQGTVRQRLACIDWYGSFLLTGSTCSMLLAISWAGSQYDWSSWPVLLPLLLGVLGVIGFVVLEAAMKTRDYALMPLRIFANRTSATIFALTFLHAMLIYWVIYFISVYCQGVLMVSPIRYAVLGLPTSILTAPAGVFAGVIVAKTGEYRLFHFAGFGLVMIGLGLYLLLDADSPYGYVVGFQIPLALGFGVFLTSSLPAALASLAEDDVAVAVGFATSTRTFGYMWGIAIASAVFEHRVETILSGSSDDVLKQALLHGQAYPNANKAFMSSLRGTPEVLTAVKDVYVASLRLVWQVALAFAALALLLCFLVRSLPLRKTLNTKYGVESRRKR